jgi:hypothetical protein
MRPFPRLTLTGLSVLSLAPNRKVLICPWYPVLPLDTISRCHQIRASSSNCANGRGVKSETAFEEFQ